MSHWEVEKKHYFWSQKKQTPAIGICACIHNWIHFPTLVLTRSSKRVKDFWIFISAGHYPAPPVWKYLISYYNNTIFTSFKHYRLSINILKIKFQNTNEVLDINQYSVTLLQSHLWLAKLPLTTPHRSRLLS